MSSDNFVINPDKKYKYAVFYNGTKLVRTDSFHPRSTPAQPVSICNVETVLFENVTQLKEWLDDDSAKKRDALKIFNLTELKYQLELNLSEK